MTQIRSSTLRQKAVVEYRAGNLSAAASLCDRLLEEDTGPEFALVLLAKIRQSEGRFSDARRLVERAICINPTSADCHLLLGRIYARVGEFDAAINSLRLAIELRPELAESHLELGHVLRNFGSLTDATNCYRRALKLAPTAALKYGLGTLLLLRGEYEEGWEGYEHRWEFSGEPKERGFSTPLWNGEWAKTGSLLLYTEQGFGDALQFVRYLPLVRQRFPGPVTLLCPHELLRLFSGSRLADLVTSSQTSLPAFSVHASLGSLPKIFGTQLETIPASVPYLSADPRIVEKWRERLSSYPGPKVGLAWAGKSSNRLNAVRSLKLSDARDLIDNKNVTFVNLSKGSCLLGTGETPPPAGLIDWTQELNDFAETAGLMTALDLVISVDTSIAHLAGALALPAWLLLPNRGDWRWLVNRSDSPWYPTARIFRRGKLGNWTRVVQHVTAELKDRFAQAHERLRITQIVKTVVLPPESASKP